jgi:hypothetical protein
MSAPTLDRAKRKRSRYIADSIGLILRQHEGLDLWKPIACVMTKDQLRFIRAALNRQAKA